MTAILPNKPDVTTISFKTLQETVGYLSLGDGKILRIVWTPHKVARSNKANLSGEYDYMVIGAVGTIVLSEEDYRAMTKNDNGV